MNIAVSKGHTDAYYDLAYIAEEEGKVVVTHSSIMKMGVELGFAPADEMKPLIEKTGKRVHAVWDKI